MKSSTYLSVGLLGAISAWMLSGSFASAPEITDTLSAPVHSEPMRVQVLALASAEITREVVVQGQLDPLRRIQVRAETSGLVTQLPRSKGEAITQGELLVGLEEADRQAQLARANADIASRRLEVKGARKLQQKGLQSAYKLSAAEASLAAAVAEQKRLQLDLARTRITAPFAGVMESRRVEQGSLVERGDVVAELVDETAMKAVGQVPQQSIAKLALGQPVKVRLLDGRETQGHITYLARVADPGSRSFRVEAEIPNPRQQLSAGVSAELRIAVAREQAHFVSPAVLTLDADGRVGVKAVNASDKVVFYPVALVSTSAEGVWVSGLPEQLRLITQGQGFVTAGETVIPVPSA